MINWDEEVLHCRQCGEELKQHQVLFYTYTCPECRMDYDEKGYEIDWDRIDYQRKQENGLV
ncbi:MAG TPA: hypothetical protein PKZ83_17670 [bacterium]|nr:hypothetical protein [bacterium]